MSKFQIITLAGFVLCIIAGVAAFALYKGNDSTTKLPPITVWGTFPSDVFNQYVATVNNTLQQSINIKYVQESPDTFSQDFVAALARGNGPDAILIPADMILPHEDKLALIPYSALTQRSFLDTFIEEAKIYLNQNGILALPFTVDPMVMYWNRDMFNAGGVATYPHYWDEFTGLNQKLTIKDQQGNVRKSAVAMGEFSNIANARELLGTLILQLGNPITTQQADGTVKSTLKVSASVQPGPALDFFTQFVNPSNVNYSWNRAMPEAKTAFLSGTLATYFGFASELKDIRSKNPNLNFDVAPLPQVRSGGQKATYGKMYGFSIVRASPNAGAVFQIITTLAQPQFISSLAQSMYLPTVRRDVIAQGSNDAYVSIFNTAALVAETWLDSSPAASRQIFSSMIESISNGQKTDFQAIQDAGDQYDIVLKQAFQ